MDQASRYVNQWVEWNDVRIASCAWRKGKKYREGERRVNDNKYCTIIVERLLTKTGTVRGHNRLLLAKFGRLFLALNSDLETRES